MLKKIIFPLSLLSIFFSGTWLALNWQRPVKMPLQLKVSGGEEENEEEAGGRRAAYEWKLLRDPKTGKIPDGIRAREMAWVKNMPVRENGLFNSPLVNNTYFAVGPTKNGGRSRAFAFDVRYNGTTNRVVLSGGINGGIFRSTDGGSTWTFVHPTDEVRSVSTLAQDPRPGFQDTWYAGTGEAVGVSAAYPNAFVYGNGIFKSTDNGLTWSKLASTADNIPNNFTQFDIISRIAVHPVTGDVYVAAQRRILRSVDGGANWVTVVEGNTGTSALLGITDVLINKAGTRLFATITGRNPDRFLVGVWTSTSGNPGSWSRIAGGENGQTDSIPGWKAYNNTISGGEFSSGWGRVVLGLAPSNQNLLYVLCENADLASDSKPEADLFRCDLSTTPFTWTKLSASLTAKRNGATATYYQVQGGYNMTVAVHPTQPSIVFVGGVNLYRSTDGFATAANTIFAGGLASNTYDDPDFISHVDFHYLIFDPTNANRLITTSDGGLVETKNANASKIKWENLNNQFQTIQYYHIGIDPTIGSKVYYGGCQDNSTTFRDAEGILGDLLPDSNDHYIIVGGDGGQVGMTKKNTAGKQYLFASAQEGQIYRMRLFPPFDETTYTLIRPTEAGKGEFVTYYHLDEDNTDLLYYVSEDTLWRTSQATTVTQTTGWTRMTGVEENISGSIFSMATTKGPYSANSHLFMGTSNGKIYRLKDPQNALAVLAPTEITPIGMSPGSIVTDIAINPRSQDTLMAVVSNYNVSSIFWTGNATAPVPQWQVIEGNLNLPSVRSCAIVAKTSGVEYYAGTSTGLFSTTTINGTSTVWSRETGGAMTTAIVNSIAYRWQDNTLVLGTHGNGMFAAYIGNAVNLPTGINDPIRNDKNFIRAAYPTLANSLITYQAGNLLTVKKVRVQISSLTGQLLYSQERNYQNGTLDVGRLPKGAYVLTITSQDLKYQFVQKFIKQ